MLPADACVLRCRCVSRDTWAVCHCTAPHRVDTVHVNTSAPDKDPDMLSSLLPEIQYRQPSQNTQQTLICGTIVWGIEQSQSESAQRAKRVAAGLSTNAVSSTNRTRACFRQRRAEFVLDRTTWHSLTRRPLSQV